MIAVLPETMFPEFVTSRVLFPAKVTPEIEAPVSFVSVQSATSSSSKVVAGFRVNSLMPPTLTRPICVGSRPATELFVTRTDVSSRSSPLTGSILIVTFPIDPAFSMVMFPRRAVIAPISPRAPFASS